MQQVPVGHPGRGPVLVRTTVSTPHTNYQAGPQQAQQQQASQPSHTGQPQQQQQQQQPSSQLHHVQQQLQQQQVRVRSLSPNGAQRQPQLPTPPHPHATAPAPKEPVPLRTPGVAVPNRAAAGRGDPGAQNYLQSWPTPSEHNGYGRLASQAAHIKEPSSPASSQATQLLYPEHLNLGTSDLGTLDPALDALSTRLDEAMAALSRQMDAGLADVREELLKVQNEAEDAIASTDSYNSQQCSELQRSVDVLQIELTSLREEFRTMDATTSGRLDGLEAGHERLDDKFETQADSFQRLEQHIEQDIRQSLTELRDKMMSEIRKRVEVNKEVNEEVQLQQQASRRLEKSVTEFSHAWPKMQQEANDLAAQLADVRDRSKDWQMLLESTQQQSREAMDQLHRQLQACKDSTAKVAQDVERRIGSIDATLQSSLSKKADQDWVDEAMHMRVQSMSTALRKEMQDRSNAVQQALDSTSLNMGRLKQMQAKIEELSMEVHEKAFSRNSTTGYTGPGSRPSVAPTAASRDSSMGGADYNKEFVCTKTGGPPKRSVQGRTSSLSWNADSSREEDDS